ncbi:putative transcriptional regulatory protein [bioreactor metagenome]|uniref:Putative transcriptional regulatory protein n=1 Tax=bioreactor metagenome TaxID=1076179 RepID=A0A645EN28_9ZZZZ
MSGHSKWANIKHTKGKADAARGQVFARISKEIIMSVRSGGANPDYNIKLKTLIAKAKENNMPNDNIARAIQRGSGQLDGVNYEELTYEGYGPGGVAIMVEVITDNRNRTAGDIRHIFDKYGGNLGETGSVNWMFAKKGVIIIDREEYPLEEDDMLMIVLEAGGEDLVVKEDVFEIYTVPSQLDTVKASLEGQFRFLLAEVSNVPNNKIQVEDEALLKLKKLLSFLNENDDVQNVYDNADYEDEDEDE